MQGEHSDQSNGPRTPDLLHQSGRLVGHVCRGKVHFFGGGGGGGTGGGAGGALPKLYIFLGRGSCWGMTWGDVTIYANVL